MLENFRGFIKYIDYLGIFIFFYYQLCGLEFILNNPRMRKTHGDEHG